MKHTFSFKEINYGSITIKSDRRPGEDEIINAIMNGDVYFKNTEYADIQLVESERSTPKKKQGCER